MIFHRLIRRFVQKYRLNDEKMLTTELGTCGEGARVCYPFTIFPKDTIHIGERTLIMPDVRLQTYFKLTGLHSKIVIGSDCYIGYRFCCLGGQDVIIDDMNTISSDVCIVSENHGFNPEDPVIYGDQPLDCGTVHICEGCWIGEQVIVLPGITIGKRSVVGAGSIVTKDIPDYSLAVGNPARVIKQYNFETHQWERV